MTTPLLRRLLLATLLTTPAVSSCVMKRTVTEHGAVVSGGYVVERPLKVLHELETTGPDEDDD
jgi:hypothetical protein